MRQVDFLHVAVKDVILLGFCASLVLLIPVLIHVERVPVEVSLAPIKLCVRCRCCRLDVGLGPDGVVEVEIRACRVVSHLV